MAKLALVIANNQYSDPGLAQLTAPGQDAEHFARVLRDMQICAFDDVKVLFNQAESLVSEAIDDFFTQKKPDDLLLLYFSGHGVRDEQGALYLAVTNTNRARLRSTGIKSDFIREAMDQSRSRRQVLILDCCNSGSFAHGTKGVLGDLMGTSQAFEGTGFGRVVLTATDSTQYAWEGDKVLGEPHTQNSLFTHFLIQGLDGAADRDGDGQITVDELYDYTYEQIVSLTPMQTPGKWSYKQQGEILLRQTGENDTRVAALPADLVVGLESSYSNFREAAVGQLGEILKGKNLALARAARMALEQVAASDDSRRVAQAAVKMLEAYGLAADPPLKPYRQTESAPDRAIASDQSPDVKGEAASSARILPGLSPTITAIIPRPGWIVAFWMTLIWTLGSLGITWGGILANYALNGNAGELPGNIIAAVLGGLIAGLAIVLTLRHYGVLRNWKGLVIIPFCFAIGIAIINMIAIAIGNSTGDTPGFVMGYSIGGAIGGAFCGLGVALALSQELGNFKWQSWLWIIACHAIGFAAGLGLVVVVFSGMEYQVGTISGGAISGAFGGIVSGACAGIGTIYQLRKDIRSTSMK